MRIEIESDSGLVIAQGRLFKGKHWLELHAGNGDGPATMAHLTLSEAEQLVHDIDVWLSELRWEEGKVKATND